MVEKQKRVLVGTYVHRVKYYCVGDFFERMKVLMQNFPDCEFMVVDNSDEKNSPAWLRLEMDRIFGKNKHLLVWDKNLVGETTREKQNRSQEILWDYALKNGFEKLMIVESDVFPKDDFTIKKLYDSGKQIVSGVFPLVTNEKDRSKDALCVMGYNYNSEMKRFWWPRWLFDKTVKKVGINLPVRVYACGLGCIMIDRKVLEVIRPEYAKKELVQDLHKVLVEVQLMRKSAMKNYLEQQVKHIMNIQKDCVKRKIHSDTFFHLAAELFGFNRYVLPEIDCEHRRSDWSEIEKIIPR